MKKLLALPLIVFCCAQGQAQIAWTGLKAGYNLSWIRYDKPAFRNDYKISPLSGFNAGIASAFRMKDRYFLHVELIYSEKGRIVRGPADLRDEAVYSFIELPLMYNVHFKGQIKFRGIRHFRYYAGVGPNFSYWLGGAGIVAHEEVTDFNKEYLTYKLKFGVRPEEHMGLTDYIYIENPNRLQLGVNFGGGLILEPQNGHKIIFDLRFELGHSWLSPGGGTDVIVPTSWQEDLRARHLGGRASIMYMLEYSLDRKAGKKGQSTKKREVKKRR